MYRKALICIILALTVLATPFGTFTTATSNTVSWLQASGINVVDGNGLKVSQSGLNIGYARGESLSLSDFDIAKSLGFNALRTNSVFWGVMQPYNESLSGIDAQYFVTGISPAIPNGVHLIPLDSIVNMAVQENMYLVICLETWTGYYVPPQWAFPAISHAGNNQVWGGTSVTLQGYTALINGTAAREQTGIINTWKFIANRYRGVPNVLFELLNEPMVFDSSLAGMPYKTFNERMISAIESVETSSHLKLIPLLRDSKWLEITNGSMDVGKPNVVWVSHHYVPWANYDPNGKYWRDDSFTWHGQYFPAGWGNGSTFVAWSIIRVASQVHTWNRPWMVTEFSKPVTQAYYADWFKTVLATMAEQQVASWQVFCYSSNPSYSTEWNINNPTTRQAMMPLLAPYMATSTTSTALNSTTQSQVSQTTSTSSTMSVTSTSMNSTVSSTVSSTTTSLSSSISKVSEQMSTGVDGGQGSVIPNCPSPNGCLEIVGQSVTVTANPSSGWSFSNWSTQLGLTCSGNPCTFSMPNQHVTLNASFTQNPPPTQSLTIAVVSGQGTVNPNCPAPSGCQETVGQAIAVTATANLGWQFSNWTLTGAACSGGSSSNPCAFSMPNYSVTVSATFTQLTQTLITGVDAGSGSLSPLCSSGCNATVGSSTTVQANPRPGWQFNGWSTQRGYSCASNNPCILNMPNNAVILKATFTQNALLNETLGQAISDTYNAPAKLGFEQTLNVFDNSGAGYMISRRSGTKVQFTFADAARVNSTTHELTFSDYGNAVVVAGRSANPTTAFYEDQGFAHLKARLNGDGTIDILHEPGDVVAQHIVPSTLNGGSDYFTMQMFQDKEHWVIVLWGIGAPGTLASGVYFDMAFSSLNGLSQGAYVVHWQDSNSNGIPDSGDSFTVVFGSSAVSVTGSGGSQPQTTQFPLTASSPFGQIISNAYSATATLGFEQTLNVFDNSGAGYMIGHRSGTKVEYTFTDSTRVDSTTHELTFSDYGNVVVVAGRSANPTTAFYEDNGFAHLKARINNDGTIDILHEPDNTLAFHVVPSTLNAGNDYFTMQAFQDNGHWVIVLWGIGAPGTLASGVYLDMGFSNLNALSQGSYVVHWQDSNGNGIPDSGDTFTVVFNGS